MRVVSYIGRIGSGVELMLSSGEQVMFELAETPTVSVSNDSFDPEELPEFCEVVDIDNVCLELDGKYFYIKDIQIETLAKEQLEESLNEWLING